MKKKIAIAIATLVLLCTTVGSAITPTLNLNRYHLYSREATELSKKISTVKEKYNLEYKNELDLTETCWLICQHSRYSKFTKYEIASIILLESRFNQFAYNKKSGAKGLGQLLNVKKDYKEQLPWLKDVYNKNQNVLATVIVLQEKYKEHNKQKYTAYIRYNGKVCDQSIDYADKVIKISNELKRI